MSDNDLIRRGDALALPPYDGDGDPAGMFDHHIFAKLSDIRALPAVQVTVKPLEWHNFDAWTHWAEGVCGTYHVEERNGYWQVELRGGGLVHGVTQTDDTTPADLDAAKAAAQADYEARIRSALTIAPAPDTEKVAALVDAADAILNAYSAIFRVGNPWGDNLRAALAAMKECPK